MTKATPASTDVEGLVKALRKQVRTQDEHSRRAVLAHNAYPDDNDHYDAARLMERAATALSQPTSPEGVPVTLPQPTLDQAEYLERLRLSETYDASTVIGGPKPIPEGMVAVPRDVLEPLAKLADAEPIMAGRGENTRPRTPADSDSYDHSYNLTWGMVRAVKKALATTPPREASR